MSILEDFGISTLLTVCSDASAAIGMVGWEGLGKVQHLAVADLWVQAKRASGDIHTRRWMARQILPTRSRKA